MRLSSAATREFGHYVYLFVDPRDNSIFYVGQGKGSRALRHLDDRRESRKVDRIREIRKAGKEPRIEILVHGLKDEETAFRIEAAVIDLIGVRSLTNAVRGRHVAEYGRREIRELEAFYKRVPVRVREEAILIRIPRLYRYGMTPTELYDATRAAWRIGAKRRKIRYALAVHDGIVREVYRVAEWFQAGTTFTTHPGRGNFSPTRWEFVGTLAEDRLRWRYIDRSVADYFKPGSKNPIRFVNV